MPFATIPSAGKSVNVPSAQALDTTETGRSVEERPRLGSSPPTEVRRDVSYDRIIREIHSYCELREGWDSYGAASISSEARRRALIFVTTLLTHLDTPVTAPVVSPSPDGGVTFRWRSQDHELLIKFLERGGEYSIARLDSDDLIEEGSVGRPEALVRDIVSRYIQN